MYIYTAVSVCPLLISELSVLPTLTSPAINRTVHTNYNKKLSDRLMPSQPPFFSRIVVQINIHFTSHFFVNQPIKVMNNGSLDI